MDVLAQIVRFDVLKIDPPESGKAGFRQDVHFENIGEEALHAMMACAGHDDRAARDFEIELRLFVARMAAHITYLSAEALTRKFGRNLQDGNALTFSFSPDFQVESYLNYQGYGFVDRFDANSYLYITRAMDYFDLGARHGGLLAKAFARAQARFFLASFTSDWLYPTAESRAIVKALNAVAADVSFAEITSDAGHDAFLLDEPELVSSLTGFLEAGADSHVRSDVGQAGS